jgi:hypothetical protein
MKIEIELLNEPTTYKAQLLVVEKYIKENTLKLESIDFFGIPVATRPTIKETPKNCGVKIETEESYRKYHVSCRRTKGGIYKFNVWNAV